MSRFEARTSAADTPKQRPGEAALRFTPNVIVFARHIAPPCPTGASQ